MAVALCTPAHFLWNLSVTTDTAPIPLTNLTSSTRSDPESDAVLTPADEALLLADAPAEVRVKEAEAPPSAVVEKRAAKPRKVRADKSGRARTPIKLVLLLGSMSALGALTTDMYLPSLPDVVLDLESTKSAVQFTITATLIGGAFGQLLIGPLSDRFGRRSPVLIGLVVHVVASLLCMATIDVAPLIALRIIQGVGNAAAGVVAVAVIRDRLSGAEASAVLSRLMLVIGVAPLLAPTFGGVLAGIWSWRAVFAALAVYGVALFVVVWRFLPESLPVHKRSTSTTAVIGSYRVLARDKQFLALAMLPALIMAAIFAYVAGSPFVLREGFGLTENQFALIFAINGAGLVAGAQVNAALVRKFAPMRVMRLALPIAAALSVVLLVVTLTGFGGLIGLLIPLGLMFAVNSLVPANASAIALTRHGERAGAAAAFIGATQSGVAGLVAPLVGALGGTASAMSLVIAGTMIAALAVLAIGTPAYRRGGWLSSRS